MIEGTNVLKMFQDDLTPDNLKEINFHADNIANYANEFLLTVDLGKDDYIVLSKKQTIILHSFLNVIIKIDDQMIEAKP